MAVDLHSEGCETEPTRRHRSHGVIAVALCVKPVACARRITPEWTGPLFEHEGGPFLGEAIAPRRRVGRESAPSSPLGAAETCGVIGDSNRPACLVPPDAVLGEVRPQRDVAPFSANG